MIAVSERGHTNESCKRPHCCVWVSEKRQRERKGKKVCHYKEVKTALFFPNVAVFFLLFGKKEKHPTAKPGLSAVPYYQLQVGLRLSVTLIS